MEYVPFSVLYETSAPPIPTRSKQKISLMNKVFLEITESGITSKIR